MDAMDYHRGGLRADSIVILDKEHHLMRPVSLALPAHATRELQGIDTTKWVDDTVKPGLGLEANCI